MKSFIFILDNCTDPQVPEENTEEDLDFTVMDPENEDHVEAAFNK